MLAQRFFLLSNLEIYFKLRQHSCWEVSPSEFRIFWRHVSHFVSTIVARFTTTGHLNVDSFGRYMSTEASDRKTQYLTHVLLKNSISTDSDSNDALRVRGKSCNVIHQHAVDILPVCKCPTKKALCIKSNGGEAMCEHHLLLSAFNSQSQQASIQSNSPQQVCLAVSWNFGGPAKLFPLIVVEWQWRRIVTESFLRFSHQFLEVHLQQQTFWKSFCLKVLFRYRRYSVFPKEV